MAGMGRANVQVPPALQAVAHKYVLRAQRPWSPARNTVPPKSQKAG